MVCTFFLFFKQKTAYEMRISDWSSDVCSSDLFGHINDYRALAEAVHARGGLVAVATDLLALTLIAAPGEWGADIDRKSVVEGKSVSVSVDPGGRRTINNTNSNA